MPNVHLSAIMVLYLEGSAIYALECKTKLTLGSYQTIVLFPVQQHGMDSTTLPRAHKTLQGLE